MELNNIENQIKKELQHREINPSPAAWDRLDAMLTVAEQKKKKRPLYFIVGIAANILVFIAVGLFLFNQSKTQPSKNSNTIIYKDTLVERNSNRTTEKNINSSESTNNTITQESTKNTSSNQGSIVASINQNKSVIKQSINKGSMKSESKSSSISNGASINTPSYINVDQLLSSVSETEPNEKVNKKTSINIDANQLLSEVENEVEIGFRDKILQSLNKNFKELKSAVANRNIE